MTPETQTADDEEHGEAERPYALTGSTQRIKTGWGRVYVTVNVGPDGGPFEVFVATGQSGGLYNSQAEALGKLVSRALRSGDDPEGLAGELMGIRSGKIDHDNGDEVTSIADAVGLALARHLHGREGEAIREGADDDHL